MNFASIEFILFFLLVFFVYWGIGRNKKTQNLIIVISSLIFYGYWNCLHLALLLLTVFTTFFCGLYLERFKSRIKRMVLCLTTIIANLGILFYYKYFNFFIDAFSDAFIFFGKEFSMNTIKLILPIGISFYTFTALGYCLDVYKGKCVANNDILAYSSFVMFFPSILSGPISRSNEQLTQYLNYRKFDYEKAKNACKLILLGGIMKLCLADRLGIYVDAVYNNIANHSGGTFFFASLFYSVQIYADFAGYSLIAIGFGKLLGIDLPTNFVRPYFSSTVTEFWRRWHISLTSWFRDYLYIPLGGSRVGNIRWMINITIVFVISGLWHGAAYNFFIWGTIHAIFMIVERFLLGKEKINDLSGTFTLYKFIYTLNTFLLVTFAWIFFRVENFNDAIEIIKKIFTEQGKVWFDFNTLFLSIIAFFIVFSIDICEELKVNLFNSKYVIVRYVIFVLSVCYILLFGVLNSGSFIYFQF